MQHNMAFLKPPNLSLIIQYKSYCMVGMMMGGGHGTQNNLNSSSGTIQGHLVAMVLTNLRVFSVIPSTNFYRILLF